MENFTFIGLTLGNQIILWILAISIVVLVTSVLLYNRANRKIPYDDTVGFYCGLAFLGGIVTTIALILGIFSFIPYNTKYWGLYSVDTKVVDVTNSFVGGDGELSANPVVTFEGIDTPVEVSDPRFLRLEGKDVTLTCMVVWHYHAADTYGCSLASVN